MRSQMTKYVKNPSSLELTQIKIKNLQVKFAAKSRVCDSAIIGCILAGGKSSRMGQDKSLMSYRNKSLLDNAAEMLVSCGIKKIIINKKLASKYQNNQYRYIEDLISNLGPVGGITSVLVSEKLQVGDKIIFLPTDMPIISVDLIKKLLTSKSTACFKNYPLPLLLVISENSILLAKKIIQEKTPIAVKELLNKLKAKEILLTTKELSQLANINHPDDWRKL